MMLSEGFNILYTEYAGKGTGFSTSIHENRPKDKRRKIKRCFTDSEFEIVSNGWDHR